MNPISLLQSRTQHFEINKNIEDLNKHLNQEINTFHFKWQAENQFIISLNFSFGSNKLFDTNYHNTKSDIMANGALIAVTNQKTKITLETKSKYWLSFLLVIPAVIFTVNLFLQLWILVPLCFTFPLFLLLILNIIRSEENKLIKKFKDFIKI